MITVIKLQGKAPNVSYVSVHIFDTQDEAQEFCQEHTIDALYWSYAVIVLPGEAFEVEYPF